jgi:hypothetical protein
MFSSRIRTLVRQQWAGLIALFLVLSGGSAYALDGSNTVFSDDIVDAEVKEADIGQGAVASGELKNDSILAGDVAPNSLTSARIADGSLNGTDVANDSLTGTDVKALTGADVVNDSLTGADVDEDTLVGGPTNPTGPAGGDLAGTYPDPEIGFRVVGSSELAGIEVVDATTSVPPSGGVGSVTAGCADGTQMISGGAFFAFPSGDLSASWASSFGPGGWNAQGQNNGGVAQDLTARAFCLGTGL